MPTAPTLEQVKTYLGDNAASYTDDQITSALQTETAAQARVVRLPADGGDVVPVVATLTVGEPNTTADSWFGPGGYVEFRPITATSNVTLSTPASDWTIDGDVVGLNDLVIEIFEADSVPGLDNQDGTRAAYISTGGADGSVVAGQSYVAALEVSGSHVGQLVDFGSILDTISGGVVGYPADLLEALLRRVQRLLEMRSKPLGYQDTATEFGVSATRVGPDPEIRRLEEPWRKLVIGRTS